jgi:2-polyprenyl-3-methyl-5-hydroxy-6-metoxy-1,4-benzoquinol methylase
MKNKEEIKAFYEKFTQTLIQDRIYPNPRHLKIKGYLSEIFRRYKFNNALEIGCGIGILSEFISKNVSSVTGLDISEENIKFANATVERVNFFSQDFLELDSNVKYDFITLFDVLEHFPRENHNKVFKKIAELSNQNTIIAITIPDPDFLFFMRKNHPEKLQVVDESIYIDDLVTVFKSVNLEILKFEKYGIDYDNQYNYYLLGYRDKDFILKKPFPENRNLLSKLINKLKSFTGRLKYAKFIKE